MSFDETENRDAKICLEAVVKLLAAAKDASQGSYKEVRPKLSRLTRKHCAKEPKTSNWQRYKLKRAKISVTLTTKTKPSIRSCRRLKRPAPEGAFIAERLIKWKPELSVTELGVTEKV